MVGALFVALVVEVRAVERGSSVHHPSHALRSQIPMHIGEGHPAVVGLRLNPPRSPLVQGGRLADPFRAEVKQHAADRGPRPLGGLTPGYFIAGLQPALCLQQSKPTLCSQCCSTGLVGRVAVVDRHSISNGSDVSTNHTASSFLLCVSVSLSLCGYLLFLGVLVSWCLGALVVKNAVP